MSQTADLNPDLDDDEDIDPEPQGSEPENATIRSLRKQNRELAKKAKKVDELERRLTERDRADALSAAKLGDLSEKQRQALLKIHEGELNAEALRATAVDLGFIADDTPSDAELAQVQQIATASAGAQPAATGVITGETVQGWAQDTQIAFMQQHPRAWEALKRGETVTGIVFG